MGPVFFLTSDLMEAARRQKHPSEAKNGMKESIYGKKGLMKVKIKKTLGKTFSKSF